MEQALRVGVVKESAPGERRVALTPDQVTKLHASGLEILVETGAGAGAWFADSIYATAGASIVSTADLYAQADVLLMVRPAAVERLRPGQTVIGLLQALTSPDLVQQLAERGVTAISLDLLPRKLSRAQVMDALTSQASVAGYKAVLVAAHNYGGFFPMMMTAAGTVRPARLLILGTGVAGLQAIGTARRLGAVVSAYDVRPESRGEVESLGASFLELPGLASGSGEGGYARALTEDEQEAQQRALNDHLINQDVVITTAQVPGRRPPMLITAETVKEMRPGSVIVDLAASELGGNVEMSIPDETIVSDNGVTIIGAGNLPSTMATAASSAYARNISAVLQYFLRDGAVHIDPDDEIHSAIVVTHAGSEDLHE